MLACHKERNSRSEPQAAQTAKDQCSAANRWTWLSEWIQMRHPISMYNDDVHTMQLQRSCIFNVINM